MLALRYLDSNQEGRINSPLVYLLTDTGNVNAALCRLLPAVAHGEPSWRGADSNRYHPAYGAGVLPLDDRAVTLDGSDPSFPA